MMSSSIGKANLLYCTDTVTAKFTADTDTGIGVGASLNDTAQALP